MSTIGAAPISWSPISSTRRSMPRRSGSIRHGSASTTFRRSVCCHAPTSCSRMSRRARKRSASPPLSASCRCITRSASPSNGRRSICCQADASISPLGAVMTGANTPRSMSPSRTINRSSKKAWGSCAGCGRARSRSRITASTISSRMWRSHRNRCSGRSPPMSRHSRGHRSNWRGGLGAI